MKKFAKAKSRDFEMFTKRPESDKAKTLAFHAQPDLVEALEKQVKERNYKSMSKFINDILSWTLQKDEEKK